MIATLPFAMASLPADLSEERVLLLERINEHATAPGAPVDPDLVEYRPGDLVRYYQLARDGYITDDCTGYSLTQKGLDILRATDALE